MIVLIYEESKQERVSSYIPDCYCNRLQTRIPLVYLSDQHPFQGPSFKVCDGRVKVPFLTRKASLALAMDIVRLNRRWVDNVGSL